LEGTEVRIKKMPVMPVMSVPPLQNTGKTEASNRQGDGEIQAKGGGIQDLCP
jgi:hypothetical protein